jgi:hypothetical protein
MNYFQFGKRRYNETLPHPVPQVKMILKSNVIIAKDI